MVATPLYDPSGSALGLFQQCATSVLAQNDQDYVWLVSVQEVHVRYEPLLELLAANDRVVVQSAGKVHSLPEHLTRVFKTVEHFPWVHIMCQDDAYTYQDSLSRIAAAVDDDALVSIEPRRVRLTSKTALPPLPLHRQSPTRAIPRRDRRHRLDCVGVNRVGGLSTIAFPGAWLRGVSSTYALLADVELRTSLWRADRRRVRLGGAMVTEHVWSGQAQVALESSSPREFSSWVDANPCALSAGSVEVLLASYYGMGQLAEAWSMAAPRTSTLARTLGRAGAAVRSRWHR